MSESSLHTFISFVKSDDSDDNNSFYSCNDAGDCHSMRSKDDSSCLTPIEKHISLPATTIVEICQENEMKNCNFLLKKRQLVTRSAADLVDLIDNCIFPERGCKSSLSRSSSKRITDHLLTMAGSKQELRVAKSLGKLNLPDWFERYYKGDSFDHHEIHKRRENNRNVMKSTTTPIEARTPRTPTPTLVASASTSTQLPTTTTTTTTIATESTTGSKSLPIQPPKLSTTPNFEDLKNLLSRRHTFANRVHLPSFPVSLWAVAQPRAISPDIQQEDRFPLNNCLPCYRHRCLHGIDVKSTSARSCYNCYAYYCSPRCRLLDWRELHKNECSIERVKHFAGECITKLSFKERNDLVYLAKCGLSTQGRGSVILAFASPFHVRAFLRGELHVMMCEPFYCPLEKLIKFQEKISIPCQRYNIDNSFVLTICIGVNDLYDVKAIHHHTRLYTQCVVLPLKL